MYSTECTTIRKSQSNNRVTVHFFDERSLDNVRASNLSVLIIPEHRNLSLMSIEPVQSNWMEADKGFCKYSLSWFYAWFKF